MTNNRLNIGLFICHLDNDYAYDICKGVDYATKELDANLIVLPGMYINAAYNDPQKARFDYQYNSIFYYASKKNLDVLIVSMGTIGSFLSEADLKSFLDNFKDIPILTIEIEVPGYNYLYIEGKTGMRKIINHLIEDHNKRVIGFVGGRPFNADAVERLNTYKEVLTEHGIPVEDKLIVHGNFSEFCEPLVEQLLDDNPDIDAMVFASDQMALGGYRVFKRRGIVVGKDIAVTGYDDAPIALTLDPPLTTCRASSSDLGYYAVYEAVNLLKHGRTARSILNSNIVIRESCGCNAVDDIKNNLPDGIDPKKNTVDEITDSIVKFLLEDYKKSYISQQLFNVMTDLFKPVIHDAIDPEVKEFNSKHVTDALSSMLSSSLPNYYSIDKVIYLFNSFGQIIFNLIDDDKKYQSFCKLSNNVFYFLSSYTSSKAYNDKKEYKLSIWSSNYITRDTLTYGRDDSTCFKLMMENILNLNYKSAYLYLYDIPVVQNNDGSWTVPESLLLQAYYNENEPTVLEDDDRIIASSDIFDNQYTPKNRRYTMVATPIFTNEQQYGLFVCEVDIEEFHHIYSSSLQLGTALKFLNLLKDQLATQHQLVLSLQEIHDKNMLLNQLSVIDELTGLYNRRGFLEKAQSFILAPEHAGKRAIIVFADMDNLKMVNDKFGHTDGDFALKSIAGILVKSFRPGDVIGRLGGDEFVAFAILDELNLATKVASNIEEFSKQLNYTSDKPYYIDMSIGISEFICSNCIDIKDIMSEADALLYSNKKYKRKSILKDIG